MVLDRKSRRKNGRDELDKNGQPVIVVNDEITIAMSPQHAKALAILLINNIIEYERQFKIKLPVPPDLQASWDKLIDQVK